jgi:hypothetical protein
MRERSLAGSVMDKIGWANENIAASCLSDLQHE